MPAALIPPDEWRRLDALRSLGLLDTPAEERFDRITRMAQRVFGVEVALVSLVDEDRQWFKSKQGTDLQETPRAVSFCAHTLGQRDVLVVDDLREDARFSDNALVVGEPNIRFYAGAPIAGPDGTQLGTLCVLDSEPRSMGADDRHVLQDLAAMIENEIAVSHLAIADELTGLSNRRGMLLLGRQVLAVCARQGVGAVLVFADLDRLKQLNDEHGHEAGNDAIVAAAEAMATTFRRADVLARVGGDEFCALLAGTDSADEPMARLREVFAARAAETGIDLGVSVGAAVYDPAHPVELEALMTEADEAMYADKARNRLGRGGVVQN